MCPGWESGGGSAWLSRTSAGEVHQGTAEPRTSSVGGKGREKNGIPPQNGHYGGDSSFLDTSGGSCHAQTGPGPPGPLMAATA